MKRPWPVFGSVTGGWPIFPEVTRALVGKTAPEALEIGRLHPGGRRLKASW
jgi:hypothetical protein